MTGKPSAGPPSSHTGRYSSLQEWAAGEAISVPVDREDLFVGALDAIMGQLGPQVELLGFGEALHGGEDILQLRNRIFRHLVERHGFRAIAVESSLPRARLVDEYVLGRGAGSFDQVRETGFSHSFGLLEANRELVEWMRRYNADRTCDAKLRFYGFDTPTEMMYADSPRQLLELVLDALLQIDHGASQAYWVRIEPLLGDDAAWANPAAMMDPGAACGLSPAASALRVVVEDLAAEIQAKRPEIVPVLGREGYLEIAHYVAAARHLLAYHAGMASRWPDRTARLLAMRDAMMADNLTYLLERERGHGRVLAFAHNSHLRCGQARWQLGPDLLTWWPAGAHASATLGSRYAVIGSAVGVSEANGIGRPEEGSLEAILTATPGPLRFVATRRGEGLPETALGSLPVRSGSLKNGSYFPLTRESITDFDWLAVLDSTEYSRGGPWLGS